jgi:hypothetical protein
MTHAFISYKHDDAMNSFIEVLKSKLEEAGLVWWIDDKLRPSEDWRQGIDNAIRTSFAVILIMTEEAKHSEYVTYEWAFGFGCNKPIVTLLLDDVNLHPRLESFQYLDFRNDNSRWDELIVALRTFRNAGIGGLVIPEDAPAELKRAKDALEGFDDNNFIAAVQGIIKLTHPAASDVIEQLLAYREQHKRFLTADTIAKATGDLRALPVLEKFLYNKAVRYCEGAAVRLAQWGRDAAEPLNVLLEFYLSADDFQAADEQGRPHFFSCDVAWWTPGYSTKSFLTRVLQILGGGHDKPKLDNHALKGDLQNGKVDIQRRLRILHLLFVIGAITNYELASLDRDETEGQAFIDQETQMMGGALHKMRLRLHNR